MEKDSIALIELGGSHDECLYSQVMFLKKQGYLVHIILFRDHLDRIDKWKEVDFWKTFEPVSWVIGKWNLVFTVRAYLRKNGIRKAIINTAEGNIIRQLAMLPRKGVQYIGLIHLSRKLWTSKSQRFINRKIKKYFVLADFIEENIEKTDPSLKTSYFYPVYFPENSYPEPPEGKNQDEIRVCIPGAVDVNRRDYSSLLDEIVLNGAPEGIRFVLLGRTTGRDGKLLLERIQEAGLENSFRWFEGFVEPRVFYNQLSDSDLILPLITPGSHDYKDYLKYKITGAYNLAWGFKIPMLMHDSFNIYEIFRQTSVFYPSGGMLKALGTMNQEKLEKVRKKISEMKDFDFELQAEKYIEFLRH